MGSEISIRVDGNFNSGLGHLVRSSALAHMLNSNFDVSLFSIEIPESFERELAEKGIRVIRIKSEEEFFERLQPHHIVVLDGYHFNTAYQNLIKDIGCKLACIDDLQEMEFVADLIINPAPGINETDYKAQPNTKFALGLEYALLRPLFLKQAKKRRKLKKIQTLIICFGGSDIKNLTESTLNIALQFKQFKKIIVVTGAAYKTKSSFTHLVTSNPRIDYRHNLQEKQILAAMLEAELAIVPASGILFEALAAGCLAISGYYINNQMAIYKGFKDSNSIFDAGDFTNLSESIQAVFSAKSDFKKVIDGLSDERFNQKFNSLLS